MKLKSSIRFYVVCIMLIGVCLGKGQVANAADTANVSLKFNKEYSSYDVTGDGRADTVKVKVVDNKDQWVSKTAKVYVNDKKVFEQKRKSDPVWDVRLIRVADGRAFFDIQSSIMSDDVCIHKLYACEDGKLKSVYDFQKYYDKYADYYFVDIVKVSGNTIKTNVRAQFYTTGIIRFNMDVKYKNGYFEPASNTFALDYKTMKKDMSMKNKWTANKKIKVYKEVGSKKVVYTLKKGNVVKLNKVIYKNNKVYFEVKNKKGKTGYIPGAKTYPSTNYFKEAYYAG